MELTHFSARLPPAQVAIRGLVFKPTENRKPHGQTEDTNFTITVSDGIAAPVTNSATVVRTTSVNDKPNRAANAAFTMTGNTTAKPSVLTIDAAHGLLVGASDPENDILTVKMVSLPSKGSLTVNAATGAFTYKPPVNFVGKVTFTYQAFDGALSSDLTTITITVTSPVPPPQTRLK